MVNSIGVLITKPNVSTSLQIWNESQMKTIPKLLALGPSNSFNRSNIAYFRCVANAITNDNLMFHAIINDNPMLHAHPKTLLYYRMHRNDYKDAMTTK
jgi:hypothetical protein